jgi:hypothetical protein
MKPLRFGSWLCSCLQVKIPIMLGPIEGANSNPRTPEVNKFEPDKLLKPSIQVLSAREIERHEIKITVSAILIVVHHR